MTAARVDTVVLDIDGTLVDSVYAHVWIWHVVFRAVGLQIASSRIHRAIGMGGDRLVEAVAGALVEERMGDEIRDQHDARFEEVLPRLSPTTGAIDLLEALATRDVRVVLASSANRSSTVDMMGMLGADARVDGWVCGDDVSSSKPAGDAVSMAVDRVGGRRAVMVGDSVWDVHAATAVGHASFGVLTGGISRAELLDAGALNVFEDPAALTEDLDQLLRDG